MNIAIERKALNDALKAVKGATELKSNLPILQTILFVAINKTTEESISIYASDLEVCAKYQLSKGYDVMESGTICIPYSPLAKIVSKSRELNICISSDDPCECTVNNLRITGCLPVADFPYHGVWDIWGVCTKADQESIAEPKPTTEPEPTTEPIPNIPEPIETETVEQKPMPEPEPIVSTPEPESNRDFVPETVIPKRSFTMTHEEFVIKAIKTLRTGNYKGIHTVYSGFNAAFKKQYPGVNPVDITKQLADEGTIVLTPAKGGVMIYLPEEAPISKTRGIDALKKMGITI